MKHPELNITTVAEGVLLVGQKRPPAYFSCCDGLLLLPPDGDHSAPVAIDINIEPHLVNEITEEFGRPSHYINTHGHMDHVAHVHAWEENGAAILAPAPEAVCLTDLGQFYRGFGFDRDLPFATVEKFADWNGYRPCSRVTPFNPGEEISVSGREIHTVPLSSHSRGHVGVFLPGPGVLHLSCLGFDQRGPGKDGFGPWYGFRECSIPRYLADIDAMESFFLSKGSLLTSSHGYIVKSPDSGPFTYMRSKIEENGTRIRAALDSSKKGSCDPCRVAEGLLDNDIFFPKKEMKGFLRDIYRLWEYWIILHHLEYD